MKKFLFTCIAFILLISSDAIGQKQIKSFKLSKTLLTYYKNVNKAEMGIINNKFQSSLDYYKKAFAAFPQGFFTDYNNAYILSSKLNDQKAQIEYAQYLIRHGVCLAFFYKFSLPMDSINFVAFYNENSKLCHTNYAFRESIDSLRDVDQDIRHVDATRSKIKEVDSMDYEAFKRLITIYKFPSVNNYGIKCNLDKTGVDYTYTILLTHFNQRKFEGILDILSAALKTGELRNDEYVKMINGAGQKIPLYAPHPILKIDSDYYEDLSYSYVHKAIDFNRKSIGLCNYTDYIQKIKFNLKNPNSPFSIFTYVFPLSTSEIGTKIFKAVKPINMGL